MLISVGAGVANFNGYIQLNTTASLLWDYLKEERTEEEMVSYLIEKCDTDEVTVKSDVSEFLSVLKEHEMVSES